MRESEHRYPEINLLDLFWYIVSKWRIILIVSFLFAALAASFKAVPSFLKLRDSSYMSALQEKNTKLTADFEEKKGSLEGQYSLIIDQLNDMERYEQSSALFQLDPRNLYASESIFYLNYRDEPVSGNNPLNNSPFAEAYQALIVNAAADYLFAASDLAYEEDDVYSNILSVTVDDSKKLLVIRVVGRTLDEAQSRMAEISTTIESNYNVIRNAIGEHSISLLSSKDFKMISNELLDKRKQFETDYVSLSEKLISIEKELNNLKEPVLSSLSLGSIVKTAIKYAIVGFVLGFFALLLVFTVQFIGRGIIFNVEELSAYPGERLGVISGKPAVYKLDNLTAKHQGFDLNSRKEDQLRLAAANIHLFSGSNRHIALLGTTSSEKISECCEALLPLLPGYTLLAMGNPLMDAETVGSLSNADSAILIETIGKTKHSDLERELHLLSRAELPLIGFMLLDGHGN